MFCFNARHKMNIIHSFSAVIFFKRMSLCGGPLTSNDCLRSAAHFYFRAMRITLEYKDVMRIRKLLSTLYNTQKVLMHLVLTLNLYQP